MKLVYLQSGYFSEPEIDPSKPSGPAESQNESMIEKEALLCYPGKFMSMDGEVEVSPEQLGRLADNHNSVLSKVKRMASGDIPLKDCPPIQLDHETKATHTVGRLVGNLEIKEAELSDGTKVPALFGKVRILGKENVEKVKDGRWIHLSIGADLEEGKLNELTITPFPAAQNAHMMSRFGNFYGDPRGLKRYFESVLDAIDRDKVEPAVLVKELENKSLEDDVKSVEKGYPEIRKMFEAAKRNIGLSKMSRLADEKVVHSATYKDDKYYIFIRDNKIYAQNDSTDKVIGPFKSVTEAESKIKSLIDDISGLSRFKEGDLKKSGVILGKHVDVFEDLNGNYVASVLEGGHVPGSYKSVDQAWNEAEKIIKSGKLNMSKLSAPYHIKSFKYKNHNIDIYDMSGFTYREADKPHYGFDIEDLDERMGNFKTEELAISAAKKLIDKMKMSRLNGEEAGVHIDINSHNIEEEEEEKMDYKSMKEKMAEYEKCKKHLAEMPKEDGSKMSEEEVEEKLASLADEDVKKMASEQDEKEKKLASESAEDKEKKMSRLAKFKEFSSKIELAQQGVKLAQKKAKIAARLSAFKSTGKITPAEIKALDLDKMATESEEIVEAKLSTFSKRQPVIDARVHGSVRGMNIAEMSKELKMNKLEKEIRSRFTSIPKKKGVKLSMDADDNTESMGGMPDEEIHSDNRMGDLEIIHKMMSEGKHEEAMAKMAEHIEKMKKMSDGEPVGHASLEEKDVEKHLSALATANETMENLNKEIQRFVADMVG